MATDSEENPPWMWNRCPVSVGGGAKKREKFRYNMPDLPHILAHFSVSLNRPWQLIHMNGARKNNSHFYNFQDSFSGKSL